MLCNRLKTIPSQGKIVVNFEYVFEFPTSVTVTDPRSRSLFSCPRRHGSLLYK